MPYSAEISRTNPSLFLFVIDRSASMDEAIENGDTKARFVADVLNKTLYQLVIRCTRAEGVRDYFQVGVLAYGGDGATAGFEGQLAEVVVHPLSAVERHPLRVEARSKKVSDGAGGLVEESVKMPVWFDPRNSGGTPMVAAMKQVAEVIVPWCNAHPTSYPPTVIHVTDGQSTDGSPEGVAEDIRLTGTNDGVCLLFNLHVDTRAGAAVTFPSAESELVDEYARLLFRMSSPLPDHLAAAARDRGYPIDPGARFFGYKAGVEQIVDFFDIGTRASNLR